eukprot:scaffold2901_cov32-Phaeocystis_antarctica.AAC.1
MSCSVMSATWSRSASGSMGVSHLGWVRVRVGVKVGVGGRVRVRVRGSMGVSHRAAAPGAASTKT